MRSEAFVDHRVEFPNDKGYLRLGEFVDGYSMHVGKFEKRSQPTDWGAGDFLATLYLRDRLERVLGQVPPGVRDELVAELNVLDRRLQDATEEDRGGRVLRSAGEVRPRSAWWWWRLPVVDPAREEFFRDEVR